RGCRLSGGDNFEAIRSNSRAQALPGAYALRAVRAGRSVRNLWLAQLPETPAPLSVRSARGSRWGTHSPSSLRKNLETEPMFSQVRVDFWRWIELWSLRSAVDYAATSLGMRIRL